LSYVAIGGRLIMRETGKTSKLPHFYTILPPPSPLLLFVSLKIGQPKQLKLNLCSSLFLQAAVVSRE
jgi:hypothetical protein